MKGRIVPIAVILSALLVSSFLAGMLVVPTGLDGQAHAQTTTGVTGNFTTEDLSVIQESLNDARGALLADDSSEAMDELDTAQRSIITLFNQSQAETETPQAEGNVTTTTENQTEATTAQNLTAEDLDIAQQSLNSVREAIHANDSGVATDELNTAYEELSSIENETSG
jgi:hypothetical protein